MMKVIRQHFAMWRHSLVVAGGKLGEQTAPDDTIQRGDTRMKVIFCGWIYKEHWTNDVGRRRGWEWWRDDS